MHVSDMTITELAALVGMTPRNIRAYQSRGLMDPPQIRGRVAYYSGIHAARLRLIASLQREGFTLAAIKRLLENTGSYASIVADRRRRFRDGSTDIPATVPVSEERVREMFPMAPADLTRTGLVWHDDDGNLVSSPVLVGVGRTLLSLGLPAQVVADLQLQAVRAGREIGAALRAQIADTGDAHDRARVAVQLSAAAFELAFLDAATEGSHDGTDGPAERGEGEETA